ncbi:MAG TPA: hypothetical protein VGS19_31575 [Streptosporangiaceae bacterium]|nr:hypothetical protein [Streptosporangiaceae bacterium]
MPERACADDPVLLERLRTWAWDRGRTDVILDLDLHACAWEFQRCCSRQTLVRLAAVLPGGALADGLEHEVRRYVDSGQSHMDVAALHRSLWDWCTQLCQRLAADLSEMAAEVGR